MTVNLRQLRQSVRKALQTLEKLLATELAILFRRKTQSTNMMRSSSASEPSLFGTDGSRKYLNATEQRRFRKAVNNLPAKQRLFCIVLSLSGGRISEVLALTPAAVDAAGGTITLRTLKQRKDRVFRQIPLPRKVINELSQRFSLTQTALDPARRNRRLWPWSRTTAWRVVKRAMTAAGVVGLAASPKGLRHTFGVSAFQGMAPPHLVQRWLGHASLRTTAIYGQVSGKEERQFAARMWDNRRS
jgi:integrase/recombinase XerD